MMKPLNRRTFLRNSTVTTTALALSQTAIAQMSPNETIHVAVVGLHNRGTAHYREFAAIPNVKVVAVCDVDERLFPKAVAEIETLFGEKPKTYVAFEEMIKDPGLDAVSIAAPDHWHAIMTVLACQSGKDVYVEKPLAYTIAEGRMMVEAARKYKRVVQVGTQHVSNPVSQKAFQFLWDGVIGELYSGRAIIFGHRGNIGYVEDSPVPEQVHWDRFLGPAPLRPFNENRFHYKWHWFWDTSTTEFGNNGVHYMDLVRRGLQKQVHPHKAHCAGNYFVFKSDQEIPNLQTASFEYEDGTITEMEVRSLYTNPEAEAKGGAFFYGSKGWMHLEPGRFRTFRGAKDEPGPSLTAKELPPPSPEEKGIDPHFKNFIDCVRSRDWQDLNADVLQGHLSTTICHLGNISLRTGDKVIFDTAKEVFIGNEKANAYLKRAYREPYVLPDHL
jgi:predicted dehydrogenase